MAISPISASLKGSFSSNEQQSGFNRGKLSQILKYPFIQEKSWPLPGN